MNSRYHFDNRSFNFKEVGSTVVDVLLKALRYFVASVSLAVIYYIIASCFISTDVEKKLKAENRLFSRLYPELQKKEYLIKDAVEVLQNKDDRIYETVFHSQAPSDSRLSSAFFLPSADTVANRDIISFTSGKVESALESASRVEDNFEAIFDLVNRSVGLPPMNIPLKEFAISRTGASTGTKLSPFSNVESEHNGLDLMAPTGTAVIAPADGTVSRVDRSRRGDGNVVEINHGNGYRTRFAHLGDITVSSGRRVKVGERIGTVGISGNSFAPHLHYEIVRDSLICNPADFLFGNLAPDDYAKVLLISSSTKQSME